MNKKAELSSKLVMLQLEILDTIPDSSRKQIIDKLFDKIYNELGSLPVSDFLENKVVENEKH